MTDKDIMASDDFQRCAQFHGHICPGLSLGYRAGKTAMARLAESRSRDEEVVAIVETDACFVDAVQELTGCTFGKGNFIYRDYGKMALTLMSRKTGRGVRICMRNDIFDPRDEHTALLEKIRRNEADDSEREHFSRLHLSRSQDILAMDESRLFKIETTANALPPPARMAPSLPCETCGEPTMGTRLTSVDGRNVCPACRQTNSSR